MTVKLGGQLRKLFFDLNTFSAFEEVTGRFFLDFLSDLQEGVRLSKESGDSTQMLRRVSIKQVRAFLWAALHNYTPDGEPEWPLTIGQMSRLIDVNNIGALLPAILSGTTVNMPETPTEEPEGRPTIGVASNPVDGGSMFGPSDEVLSASLTLTSAD